MNTPSSRTRKQIYEGKAKILYEGPEPGTLIQYFKDDATAFNGKKRSTIAGKGVLNNRISGYLMTKLAEIGVPTHFIRTLNMREQLVRAVEIIPLEVVVRNVVAGSLCARLGLEEGTPLSKPIIELYYKNDKLNDPMINGDHVIALGFADDSELEDIRTYTTRINDYLRGLFMGVGILLVDFKLEFGRIYQDDYSSVVLADEISPDSCRLWDAKTRKKLDKDRFRRDLGGVAEAYHEVAKRLGVLVENIMEEEEKPSASKAKKTSPSKNKPTPKKKR